MGGSDWVGMEILEFGRFSHFSMGDGSMTVYFVIDYRIVRFSVAHLLKVG